MKKFLKLLTIAVLLGSCSTSDDSDTKTDQQTSDKVSLLGVWSIEQVEIKYRCDNDALLDEGWDPDTVDNIGDLEFTENGTYHLLDDNGEVADIEDFNGQYEVEGDIVTFFYTAYGAPLTSTSRIIYTEEGDLELQRINYCETHADLDVYYSDRYVRIP